LSRSGFGLNELLAVSNDVGDVFSTVSH
jgi:hypothetical protein